MDDRFNTMAGWALFAGIVALGGTIVSGEYFRHHEVEKGGYEVADASPEAGGAASAKPTDFSAGDPVKGAAVFAKCQSCHSIEAGGANGIGPNLHASMGKPFAHVAGFAYSDALKSKGGNWGWSEMDAWLASPKKYVNGTKMSFAGLSNPEDRANVIRYLNDQGSNLPVPPPPAAEAATADAAATTTAAEAPGKVQTSAVPSPPVADTGNASTPAPAASAK